jgi:nucleoside-diphosphate-sugar epimerase
VVEPAGRARTDPGALPPLILYNGASGGLGRHLAQAALRNGLLVRAIRSRLEDRAALAAELALVPPTESVAFVHLAAMVSVPACEANPDLAYRTNVTGAAATVEAVVDWAATRGMSSRVVYVSTGHVYAPPVNRRPVVEAAALGPRSAYARTKLAAEREIQAIAERTGAALVIARVFGLIAPGQPAHYVLPALIDRARTGRIEAIPGLDNVRDYLDARDVCDDLLLLATTIRPGSPRVVNVCSGVPVTIRELLRTVLLEMDPENADDEARRATSAAGRPDDIQWLVGDPRRFIRLTGSLPQRIPLSRTIADALEHVE